MAVLRVTDENGNWVEIPAIVGSPGKDYVLTVSDKQQIAEMAAKLVDVPDDPDTPRFEIDNETLILKDGVLQVDAEKVFDDLNEEQLEKIKGEPGTSVTITKITESSESGGSNVVEFSDGKKLNVMNGKDGYTPQKGVDYTDGDDGITPHVGSNGNWYIGNTDTGIKAQGEDGVSPALSVSKSGKVTTITIKDANGTKTAQINDGIDGDTPVRGTDYWTDSDKAEIKSYVDEAILGGAW